MLAPGLDADAILLDTVVGAGLREARALAVGVAVPELDEEEVLEEAPEARGSMDEVRVELGAGADVD